MCRSKTVIDKFNAMVARKDAKRMASKTPFPGVEKFYDIPYIDDGNIYHLLDVYRPENLSEGERLPVIIDIHGGAWIYGTKEINAHYCQGLTKYGYCVVNINYRIITEEGKGTFPAILNDCFAAFKWVEENISDYGGDLNDVYLTGDSAGAHLAAMCVAINGDKKLREEPRVGTYLRRVRRGKAPQNKTPRNKLSLQALFRQRLENTPLSVYRHVKKSRPVGLTAGIPQHLKIRLYAFRRPVF